MLRPISRCARSISPLVTRSTRNYWDWGRRGGPPSPLSFPVSVFDDAWQRVNQVAREMDRVAGSPFRPFLDREHPVSTELFRIQNPIVEEDGLKKFKLEFDVRRFKPEDVKISTDSKENILKVEATHCDEDSHFEYYRKVSIPAGVKPTDITCKYKSDGVLELEAPYTEPKKPELPKEKVIEISHK
ncbi:hsp20/alpha crystallin family domain-containing protein [Ditylenchus destructor]|nr:hsp20/alpha crystallin family domain-containing protein [Ditylenchus destructor]